MGVYRDLERRREYVRKYRAKNREKTKEQFYRHLRKSPRHTLWMAVTNAKRRGTGAVSITVDELMDLWRAQEGKCALSGIRMTWSRGLGKGVPTNISLDRIDPLGPYSLSNVRLVCWAINAFRQRMSDHEMLNMAECIVSHLKQLKSALAA